MEISHQFNFQSSAAPKLLNILRDNGLEFSAIEISKKAGLSIRFNIKETDEIWPRVRPWIGIPNIRHHVETYFSDDEILDADWLRAISTYSYGYPQPESSWVTHPNNYKVICNKCGTYSQILPFHIKSEPKLGKYHFLSLEWTAGIFFSTPKIIEHLQANEIKGFETWNAIIHNAGVPSQSISQIFTPNLTLTGLIDVDELPRKICPNCGTIKYEYHRYGTMKYKRASLPSTIDIIQTNEWFGSGHFAYHEVFVSKRFAELIIRNKWNGIRMKVIEPI